MATVSPLGDTERKASQRRVAVGIGVVQIPDFDDGVAHRINAMAVSPSHRGTSWSRMKRKIAEQPTRKTRVAAADP
jgi:hypothetical protein